MSKITIEEKFTQWLILVRSDREYGWVKLSLEEAKEIRDYFIHIISSHRTTIDDDQSK